MTYLERQTILVNILNARINTSSSPRYQSYLKTKQYGYEKINRFFNGTNVLELGTDESSTSSVLARWSDKLTIVDMQDKFSRQIANDNALEMACFIQAKWEEFTPDELYSDVVLTDSLEHLDDPSGLLKLIGGWLASGGRLHIIVPNAKSVHRLLGVEMGMMSSPYELNKNDVQSGHRRVYDMMSLTKDIRAAGLDMLTLEGVQFKPMTDVQLAGFSDEFHKALSSLSCYFNEYCAEIYACCYKKH